MSSSLNIKDTSQRSSSLDYVSQRSSLNIKDTTQESTSVDHTSQKSGDTKNITTSIENAILNSNSIILPLVIIGSIITITIWKSKTVKKN